jgi:ribosomal-protein-alanine N-acetyltransferase
MAAVHAAANPAESAWSQDDFAKLLGTTGVFTTSDNLCFCLARVVMDEAEILTIATHPDHRNKGYAKRALTLFETEARSRKAVTAFLEVAADNLAALRLYDACGYRQTGLRKGYYRRKNEQNVDALLMSKILTSG